MSRITYQTVLRLINNINSFAEESDRKIQQLWDNFNNSKRNLEEQYNRFMSNANTAFDNNTATINKKAAALKDNADKIYREVLALDNILTNADKYYVKTKTKKEMELAEKTQVSITEEVDIFAALDKVKNQFGVLSEKYSKDKLPALFDSINFAFSEKRKHDYEELIILKNTLEKLMSEIKITISELISDSKQTDKESHAKKTSEIESKYQLELSAVKARYENNVEALADEICGQLDIILPDSLLHLLNEINSQYQKSFSEITSSYNTWDGTVIIGYIDYPLELYVNSNILFSLIKDKCLAIIVQNKLLRFPLVFSLINDLNLLIKHTSDSNLKNQFICSVVQSFIASVPVKNMSFYIIDSENQCNTLPSISHFCTKPPELFNGGIKTSNVEILDTLEKLNDRISEVSPIKYIDSLEKVLKAISNVDTEDNSTTIDNAEELPDIKVLVIFDSPESLGNKNVELINNIIDNGSSRGIYTVIGYNQPPNAQARNELPPYHEKGCIIFQQAVDMFLYYNLRVTYKQVFDNNELSKYINKYYLLYKSITDKISLLDSSIRELIVDKSPEKLEGIIDTIITSIEKHSNTFGKAPQNNQSFPAYFPVGSLLYPLNLISDTKVSALLQSKLSKTSSEAINLPAIFNLHEKSNLLITCSESVHLQIEKFIHNLMWSFLTFLPASKINFCIFDAERRGNSITPFLDFRQKQPDIFDNQIYTTQDAMINRLQKINRYIDEFIQDKLGNRYNNIVEYNINTPNRVEPITLLMIFDFPRNFDNRSMELLLNILNNGSKCGIYTVICHNPGIVFSKYESIDEYLENIKSHCSLIEYTDKKYILQPFGLPIDILPELTKDKVSNFIDEYIKINTDIKQKSLSFDDIVLPPYFTASTAKKLSIPVGIGDGENIVNLVLGEGSSHHGIIAGATGSGKSSLLHTIIMSGMLCHSPDELHLYLMDFKSGTEFKIYESDNLPHIQLLALDAMQEFGESILENLVSEMLRRGDLFKTAGQTSLADYINNTGKALPRILVIMDEFQILFNDSVNRKIAMNCAELTKRIVTEGRAFGIHLLMATQTTKVISELTLSHGIIEQMRVRIGLKCGEDDVRYLFSDRNDTKALEMMKGPIGTAVMNLEYMESNNTGFRAAYCSKEMQSKYLALISEKYVNTPSTMQIFEGNRAVMLFDYLIQNKICYSAEAMIKVHMGLLIKVAPPFIMNFDRRRKHNLLICGSNERMAENIANLCILSALLNTNTDVFCIDGENIIGENGSLSFYDCLTDSTSRFRAAKNRSVIIEYINEIHSQYLERKKETVLKQTFVIIKNLQFLDIIKKIFKGESVNENDYGDIASKQTTSTFDFGTSGNYNASSLSITEKLFQLIDDGSNYGIFFVVSSLEYQCVKENMYYGENILSKFPERITFALSNNDSDNLIEGVSTSSLRDNTVYFSDGIKNAFQFKPYIMPDVSEIKSFFNDLS